MRIRKATGLDLDVLVPLFDSYRMFYRQLSDVDGARDFLRARFERKESIIFLAFAKAESTKTHALPIGFMQLYPLFSSVSMQPMLLLNDLFIHSDHRGTGAGTGLINEAKNLCRASNQKGLAIQTEKANPAQHLYLREGFKPDPDLHLFWTTK